MNISIIGGGAWGTTLGQTLHDNGHRVLIYDINPKAVEKINNHFHPFFDTILPDEVVATTSLKEVIDFSNYFILSVPTKAVRSVLKEINEVLNKPSVFINVSKGIEPQTLKRVSEIVEEEIDKKNLEGFVVLTGPSHAEEVILRKLTLLVSSSKDQKLSEQIQLIFSNEQYLRVYTSNDLIGCEVGGAVKNAIAVISGACTGLGLGENARAAVITRGIIEIIRVVEIMGGKKETAYGLTGIGDLIVTASSENSRNFTAGKKIGQGIPVDQIYAEQKQTIEGIRTIEAMYHLAKEYNVELPMINAAYDIIFNDLPVKEALQNLLSRDLKSEDF
ncbi:NAD(P)H-dependent glycerol-3-phosphate dehydrogenase [Peloplasma aerotolerans]|uniref:Glycerol-3-phosphate dehydrogenase [NAD(P)+] n=1 Tax=Peloplasma aerotolerans TaxID=3044389 RepID=A0AAW6UA07_9MOLU|nr:NAD(P)H-dependent glycerol-3-phosphate dehydrogenase [Mariniplasma sp. M4Ah]MDI6452341.1 NAD(P)H-dependent glycerol-3-phosphate dehydrogenase [Mariniplasma sp. M4Ah]